MDQSEINQAFKEHENAMKEWYERINANIESVLNSIGGNAKKDFEDLLQDSHVSGEISFVDSPHGQHQPDDSNETFVDVYVDQFTGITGDDFSGEIYGKLSDGRWLKIPFEC